LRLDPGSKAPISEAAGIHGDLRRKQGYTVAMAVEESRLLQVTIFSTLHKDVTRLNFKTLLLDVVTIADEVDAQLKQQSCGSWPRMPPSSPRALKSCLWMKPRRVYGAFPIHQRTLATIFNDSLALRVTASYSLFSGWRTSV
jgi:hypothetical protein